MDKIVIIIPMITGYLGGSFVALVKKQGLKFLRDHLDIFLE